MTADAAVFRLVNRVEAFENGERIFADERAFEVSSRSRLVLT